MTVTLFRTVRRKAAALGDFWSDFALGETPQSGQLREPLMWAGISMFSAPEKAMDKARTYGQGRFLAVVVIPDDAPRLSGRDPLHYSVMGTPAVLRGLVAQVLPIS